MLTREESAAARRLAREIIARSAAAAAWRPRVLVHYAQTLDGRIATRSGSSRWISGPAALCFAHELRAAHDAVLVGRGTVRRDDPRLTVRYADGPDPLKVLLDSRLRTPLSAALLRETPGRVLVLTTPAAAPDAVARLTRAGARVLVAPPGDDGRVDLAAGLRLLADQGVRSVMVEGGSRVITALLRRGLVDQLVLCIAPLVLGRGVEGVGDLGVARLSDALGLEHVCVAQLGRDLIVSGALQRVAAAPTPDHAE